MRRLVIVACSLFALVFAATATARDPRAEREQLRPADMKVARGAVLRTRDFKTRWKAQTPDQDGPGGCASFRPDFSQFVITGKAKSDLHATGWRLVSQLAIFASQAQAAADFRLSVKALMRCEMTKKTEKDGDVTMDVIAATHTAAPGIGQQSARFQLAGRVSRPGRKPVTFYTDVIVFQQGRAIGGVIATSAQPARGVDALARVMLQRIGA
jgi:hypothetical protein